MPAACCTDNVGPQSHHVNQQTKKKSVRDPKNDVLTTLTKWLLMPNPSMISTWVSGVKSSLPQQMPPTPK